MMLVLLVNIFHWNFSCVTIFPDYSIYLYAKMLETKYYTQNNDYTLCSTFTYIIRMLGIAVSLQQTLMNYQQVQIKHQNYNLNNLMDCV